MRANGVTQVAASLAALLAASGALAPNRAAADVDPPSDYLLVQESYVPRVPQPSAGLADRLERLAREIKAAGYPLKVAVISSEVDLGAVPFFLHQPSDYAQFLGEELDGGSHAQPLLVVTPAGVAAYPPSAEANRALDDIEVPQDVEPGALSDDLVETAILAAAKLARSMGHPVEVPELDPSADGGANSGGVASLFAFALPVLAMVGLLILLGLRKTRRGDGSHDPEAPGS